MNIYIYILIMGIVTYLVRALPLILIRRPIRNKIIRSFLYYIPYTTLAVMTFPAIMYSTRNPYAGLLALIAGCFCAWKNWNLFQVACIVCIVVYTAELFLV